MGRNKRTSTACFTATASLRRHVADQSVYLVYLDPPFNSQREYNVIFREKSGAEAASQQQAFMDSWHWSQAAETYDESIRAGGRLTDIMTALHALFGPGDFLAYLAMMAARLGFYTVS